MPATSTTRSRRRTRRQPSQDPTRAASRAPLPVDHRRYLDFRAGVPAAELATRENVRLPTIEASLQRVISHNAQFSQEQAEIAARQLFLQTAPKVAEALTGALAATRTRTKKELVLRRDVMTGTEDWVETENEVIEPDHKTRLSAVDTWKSLPGAASPRQPGVMVDARTQVNNGGQASLGSGPNQFALGAGSGPLSAEAIIMQLRKERGLSAQSVQAASDAPTVNMDRDFELEAEMAEDGEFEDESQQQLDQPAEAS